MSSRQDALIDEVVTAMHRVFRAVEASTIPTWIHFDLTMGQVKAGMLLSCQGPMTIGQLASTLGIGQPAASVLVDRLVHDGLVEREEDPVDRRRTWARLSAKGEETIGRIRRYRLDRMRDYLGRLDQDALEAFAHGACSLASVVAEDVCPVREAPRAKATSEVNHEGSR